MQFSLEDFIYNRAFEGVQRLHIEKHKDLKKSYLQRYNSLDKDQETLF